MPKPYNIAQTWDPRFVNNLIQVLVEALEVRDSYIQGHTRRVAEISLAIGARMGLSQIELRDLYAGAILHDIGKAVGTTEETLNKPMPGVHISEICGLTIFCLQMCWNIYMTR